MTTRSWIGGHMGNDMYAASNWSPAGVPGSGDTLSMASGVATMNGGNLAGDTLAIGASASSNVPYSATVNLAGKAVLSALVSNAAGTRQQVTFNAAGMATLDLKEQANYAATTTITENIAPHSTLQGHFVGQGHNPSITVNGADGTSRFANTGASSIAGGVAVIDADVIGVGSFTAGFFSGISFLGSVSAGQVVNSGGFDRITIGKPEAFQGLVNYAGGPTNTIDLLGITTADSYSYRNDILSLYQGGKVVDTLRMAAGASQFQVTETTRGVSVGGLPGAPPPAGTLVLPRLP